MSGLILESDIKSELHAGSSKSQAKFCVSLASPQKRTQADRSLQMETMQNSVASCGFNLKPGGTWGFGKSLL